MQRGKSHELGSSGGGGGLKPTPATSKPPSMVGEITMGHMGALCPELTCSGPGARELAEGLEGLQQVRDGLRAVTSLVLRADLMKKAS